MMGSDQDEQGDAPAGQDDDFSRRMREKAEEKRRQKEAQKGAQTNENDTGKRASPEEEEEIRRIGEFEKHTKGFGMKMLEKMGYKKGKGLGKHEQGIRTHVEVKQRPNRMGMGYGDFKEAPPQEKEKFEASRRPAPSPQTQQAKQAKSQSKQKPKKEKPSYKMPSETSSQPGEHERKPESLKVIDMRGATAKLTDAAEIATEQEGGEEGQGEDEDLPLPELQHNLSLVVQMSRAEVENLEKKLKYQQESVQAHEDAAQKHYAESDSHKRSAQSIRSMVSKMRQVESASSIDSLIDQLSAVQREHAREYTQFSMESVAYKSALPLVRREMEHWEPLKDPRHGVEKLAKLKPLLEGNSSGQADQDASNDIFDDHSSDAYVSIISSAVLPPIRSALLQWDATDPDPALELVEVWASALPEHLLRDLLEGSVLPRIKESVNAWNPRESKTMLHTWIHPWLPRMARQLESLHEQIRFKFSEALKDWHPSDKSPIHVLSPWKEVFRAKEWDQLMIRAIIPKLERAFNELDVNPAAQDLRPFKWVMAWEEMVPTRLMVALLEKKFFPKWREALKAWLQQDPDFGEVERWYTGWKAQFSENLQAHERIRGQFNRALKMMNSVVSGEPIEDEPWQPPRASSAEQATASEEHPATFRSRQEAAASAASLHRPAAGMRDLLEAFAQEQSIEFLPKSGRQHEGLQVYSFGGVSIVMDPQKQLLKAYSDGEWKPTSLEELMQMAKG